MKVMVTGATGFVGRHLLRYLSDNTQCDIIGLCGPNGTPAVSPQYSRIVQWETVDLTNSRAVRSLIAMIMPDQVYHLAGIAVTSGVDMEMYYRTNVTGTLNLAEAVLDTCGPGTKFLYVSSAAVYGGPVRTITSADLPITESQPLRPKNLYGVSKAFAEAVLWPLWRRGLNLRIARPFNHTGPGQQQGFVCPDIAFRLKKCITETKDENSPIELKVSHLDAIRDFSDVRDVVHAYALIMEKFESGEVVNVASGVARRMKEVAETLCYDVAGLSNVVLRPVGSGDPFDVLLGDSSLLNRRTGWSPTIPFAQTLRDLWMSKEMET